MRFGMAKKGSGGTASKGVMKHGYKGGGKDSGFVTTPMNISSKKGFKGGK